MEINIVVSILFIISFLIIIVGFLMAPDSNSFQEQLLVLLTLDYFHKQKNKDERNF